MTAAGLLIANAFPGICPLIFVCNDLKEGESASLLVGVASLAARALGFNIAPIFQCNVYQFDMEIRQKYPLLCGALSTGGGRQNTKNATILALCCVE